MSGCTGTSLWPWVGQHGRVSVTVTLMPMRLGVLLEGLQDFSGHLNRAQTLKAIARIPHGAFDPTNHVLLVCDPLVQSDVANCRAAVLN